MIKDKYVTIIVDDEKWCIDNIRSSLSLYPEVVVAGIAENARAGIELILKHKPDLVFTDVEMPGMDGLKMMDELAGRINWPVRVIFCTAYDEYLLSALRADAFYFLLKPYTEDEFKAVAKRFFLKANKEGQMNEIQQFVGDFLANNRKIVISTSSGILKVKNEQIIYFEYQKLKKKWFVVLSDHATIELKKGTTSEHILRYSHHLIQINLFQIVNLNYVFTAQTNQCLLVEPYHLSFTIGRSYQDEFMRRFMLE
jgi:two-component system LytT family response regulator